MRSPIRVEIYSRHGCHLCDEARTVIDRVRARARGQYSVELSVIDIDRDPALVAAYGEEIPVIMLDGHKEFIYTVDERELERKLKALWSK